jgi:cytochrome c553
VGVVRGDAANSEVRSLAATCAACHGTDGHSVAGPAILRLAGLPKADFVRQMRAFREGTVQATVMRQIAKGFSDEQTVELGDYFAAQR